MFAWFHKTSPENRGALLLVMGISIFGFSDNLSLLVSDQVGVGQFHFSRSLFAIILIATVSRFLGYSIMPRHWKPMIARTVFMVIAILVYFSVMPMMPIAEAGAFSNWHHWHDAEINKYRDDHKGCSGNHWLPTHRHNGIIQKTANGDNKQDCKN